MEMELVIEIGFEWNNRILNTGLKWRNWDWTRL